MTAKTFVYMWLCFWGGFLGGMIFMDHSWRREVLRVTKRINASLDPRSADPAATDRKSVV